MSKVGLSPQQILEAIDNCDFSSGKDKIALKIEWLNKYISWSDEDYKEYEKLLNDLKNIRKTMNKKNKRDKQDSSKMGLGKALEKTVNFIFEKSYFFKVYPNKRTATNEIDQFVVLSDYGKQAIEEYKISKDLLGITDGYFLKNY